VTSLQQLEERAKEVAPRPVRTAVKRGVRVFGVATAPLRTFPDFMIIGAKRGGTTSLYRYLLHHPDVAPLFPRAQNIKGVRFFDTNFHRGASWYRSHFPSVTARRLARAGGKDWIVGEASPYYLFHPRAPHRAARVVPAVRLIALLRDPVERAYSHYKERRRGGTEPLSFEDALDREEERLSGEAQRMRADARYVSFPHEHQSYVAQGIYRPQLEAWLSRFPRERVCVLRSEDLFGDPETIWEQILAFLGLRPSAPPEFVRYNYHPSPDMPATLRDRLASFFAPHNQLLAEFLDMDLGWQS
jgi:hypothetical protein